MGGEAASRDKSTISPTAVSPPSPLLLLSSVVLDKSHFLLQPQFPYVQNENSSSTGREEVRGRVKIMASHQEQA